MTAEVQSVADLNSGYWGDEVNSSGLVTNDYSQTVEVSKDDEIKEVYVEEGQQVQDGAINDVATLAGTLAEQAGGGL